MTTERIGIAVYCTSCGQRKKPIGRSAPLGFYLCDHECPGYHDVPLPGDLWPGERESDFGYPVSEDGTALVTIRGRGTRL